MSDPVTNIDIEDVLSSIRRLVAEGEVPAPPQRRDEAKPAEEAAAGRLILTAALRVDQSEPVAAAEPMPEEPEAEPAAEAEAMAADADAPAPVQGDRSRLEATIAELEAAVADQTIDWEPDGSEETPVIDWASSEIVGGAFFTHREDRARPAPPEETGDPQEEDVAEEEEEVAPAPLPFTKADLGAGLSDEDDEDEDDAATPVLDEEMLRLLIADVVRQELQGELGERITRNVRKLVRREIYRVLSSQDFD